MIKTVSATCPKCKKFNSFNVPGHMSGVTDINVPWFQCSFCFQRSPRDCWDNKKTPEFKSYVLGVPYEEDEQ
ncbi:zinc binding domain protein [Bacillus phage 010DV004]|nr:zinc binding domain protein [Bacillus phage 010DV004]QZA69468.1 zinc binding domain protein [Bacillus phage 010DV005]QZA70039.1 hypothetical protein 043JT007_258 [Bacillus phage 043JT007]